MRYRTVLFDVGETLIGPQESFGAIYARVLEPLGLERPVEAFDEALREQWEEMNRMVPPGTDRYALFPGGERGYWLRFAQGAIDRVGGGPMPEDFAERVLDALRDAFKSRDAWLIYDDVVPTLETLLDAGVRMGVVSNWDTRLPNVLERLDLGRFFESVIVSSVEGVEKPDPLIFRRALTSLGAEAATTMHVGDLPEVDLAGAEAAGIRGVLVDRKGRLDPALDALPDLTGLVPMVLDGTE
jgi:putative hydrolase of the HAD superfamily